MVNNKNHFKVTAEIHNINTRNKSNLFQPLSHSTTYQKGLYYLGIKVYNCYPSQIKNVSHNITKFKSALKDFLHFHFLHQTNILTTIKFKSFGFLFIQIICTFWIVVAYNVSCNVCIILLSILISSI